MNIFKLGRIAGAVALTIGLAGCFDMTMDINVASPDMATSTVTQTMGADIYAMIKSAGDQGGSSEPWCKDEGDTLTENGDGSATCVSVSSGQFDALKFDDGEGKPTFTSAGPGLVRIAVPTKDMVGDLGSDSDPESAAMMKQLFEGHNLTIRFGGKRVTDTNMTLTADGTYAEIVIPFLGLMDGTAQLPEELYAVIDTN